MKVDTALAVGVGDAKRTVEMPIGGGGEATVDSVLVSDRNRLGTI